MMDTIESVSLRQLRALVSIGDTASFTGAAEQLGMSQPSVSHLIRRLEAEVGQTLVVRGREVTLTRQGQALADIARRAILSIDGAVRESRDQSALKSGSVSVAVGHVSAATLLPRILVAFNQRHPNIELIVVDCVVEQIRNKLLSHEADVGLGAVVGSDDSRLSTELLWDGGVSLFMRDDHYLADREAIDAAILAELPCIQLNPNAPPWLVISRLLVANGIHPRVEQRVVLVSTAVGMIQAGMGVAMLPHAAAAQAPRGVRAVPIRNPFLSWPISLVRLSNHPLSPAAQAFAAVARDVLRRL
ncbi:LysR family transcriptional regulator [Bordetella bronchiseptica]|uniref:LysR family transcriptional regulator n=1 Tax=Bordetella bronchiseptica TaxID=518 RepID=UPI0004596FAB|nr:LysR family transcriptional regulator [Bordetella bronchiseptica]AOB26546.1 LysR family transcriptional regulator [Bordetella bronchiseptica]AZW43852.1 LysR family transcriptional regulator [Bordetella bronchiseptica]KCV61116.1 LysR substrate-binding domain protein [Bordetella bronchiseptica 99-R-0433]MBN3269280.1 LysR family transcriptional regulator [Bordetella bronchiseptica]